MAGNVGKIENWQIEPIYGRPKWILNLGLTTVQVKATMQRIPLNMCKEQTNVYQRMIIKGLYEPVYHSGSGQSLNNVH